MSILAVCRAIDAKDNNIGLGLLDTTTKDLKLVPISQVTQAIEKGIIKIDNLEVIKGVLKGSNGEIDRLPTVSQQGQLIGKDKCTIINAVSTGEKTIAFDVALYDGGVRRVAYNDVVDFGEYSGITNGKIVTTNGEKIVSSIKGTYNIIVVEDPNKKVTEAPKAVINTPKETNKSYLFKEGFNKSNLKNMRTILDNALKEIKDNYGIDIKIGGITFEPSRFTARLEANIVVEGKTTEQVQFEKYAEYWGFRLSDFGREFRNGKDIYEITGAKPKADKYKIVGKSVSTDKEFVFTIDTVKKGFI